MDLPKTRTASVVPDLFSWNAMPSLALRPTASSRDVALNQLLVDRRFALACAVPAIILALGTLLFWTTDFDRQICRMFYNEQDQTFPLLHAQPWDLLYHYGPLPGMILGIAGGIVGLVGVLLGKWKTWGKAGIFLGLVLAIGPGLAVNGIFKPNWGRPRPNQVAEFGGDQQFLRVGQPGTGSEHRSFPCGHASMGFYLLAPAFLFVRNRPRLALAFLLLGLAAGGFLGVGRVVQGRHFPSDVLWSAGMVYFSGLVTWLLLGLWRIQPTWGTSPTPESEESLDDPAILSLERERSRRAAAEEFAGDAERRKSA